MGINIFGAYVVNRYLTRCVGQVHSMQGLVLTLDEDLTGPESGVAAWLHVSACLYSRSACSYQTHASVDLYHNSAPFIPALNQELHHPSALNGCFSLTSSISSIN
jgi:hypothetical protein